MRSRIPVILGLIAVLGAALATPFWLSYKERLRPGGLATLEADAEKGDAEAQYSLG